MIQESLANLTLPFCQKNINYVKIQTVTSDFATMNAKNKK